LDSEKLADRRSHRYHLPPMTIRLAYAEYDVGISAAFLSHP
jgi:hypothetical protein